MLRNPCVYLAGSIEGLTFMEAENWRVYAADYLTAASIDSFDPFTAYEQPVPENLMSEVWASNITKIHQCDIFLCVLNPNGRSVGSIRELQMALDRKKDVYLVDEHLYYGAKNSVWDIPLYHDLGDALHDIKVRWSGLLINRPIAVQWVALEHKAEIPSDIKETEEFVRYRSANGDSAG